MHSRRKYLAGVGAAAAVAVSGCTDLLEQEPEPPEEDSFTLEVDAFHSASASTCAHESEGSITIDRHPEFNNNIMFSGTLLTPNPGYEAVMADESYDEETGTFTIVMEAKNTTSDDEATIDCIGAVDYSGGLMFDGGVPLRLRIEHNTSADDAVEEITLFD